jgi:SEC-C motif domain protein
MIVRSFVWKVLIIFSIIRKLACSCCFLHATITKTDIALFVPFSVTTSNPANPSHGIIIQFVASRRRQQQQQKIIHINHCILFASSSSSKRGQGGNTKNNFGTTSMGFGGAAIQPCPCGSKIPYNKCCGLIHSDPAVYAQASAEQVVRARYSAYAKRVVDFIINSTHPENTNFVQDIQHWKQTIERDCYDNFELTKCEILASHDNDDNAISPATTDDVAQVRFVAHMKQSDTKEQRSFMETSTFVRHPITGAWLYREGIVDTVDNNENKNKKGS